MGKNKRHHFLCKPGHSNVGQEVFGDIHPTTVRDTYSDYAILSEDELVPKPPSVTHVEESAIPFVALTVWRDLKSTARIST
jgi:NADPH:quinone reductase-like Zn-dependent oxidoreductase